MFAIETDKLTRSFGARRGIEAVSLRVPQGSLFGFIGPNGAGKSTTIRTLLGLLRPTAGSARLLGKDVVKEGAASRVGVGYVPGESHFPDGLRVREVLALLGDFQPGTHTVRRRELVETFELDVEARASDLSLGNRKKVSLVAGLQHRPELLVLDEPTNGLDPVMQARLFDVLQQECARGCTVFFSSHVLSEVQRVCRTVAVLNEGKLVTVAAVEELRRQQVRRVRIVPTQLAAARTQLAALAGTSDFTVDGEALSFLYGNGAAIPALLTALAALAPTEVRIEEPSLDELFLRLYATNAPQENAHE